MLSRTPALLLFLFGPPKNILDEEQLEYSCLSTLWLDDYDIYYLFIFVYN